jgi:hypothetical protein
MGRIEEIRDRFNKYEYVHSYIDSQGCNEEWDEAHRSMRCLLSRLQIAEEALRHISDLHIRGIEDRAAEAHRQIAKQTLEQIRQ